MFYLLYNFKAILTRNNTNDCLLKFILLDAFYVCEIDLVSSTVLNVLIWSYLHLTNYQFILIN